MADESISIEITDKVAASISEKIQTIASSARDGFAAVEKLKDALGALRTAAPLAKLQTEISKLNTALLRNVDTQNKLVISDNKAALAKQKLATESQKTAAAMLQTETILNRAIVAENAAALSTIKNAQAQQVLINSTEKLRTVQAQAATEAQRLATEEQRTATQAAAAAAAVDRAAVASLKLAQAQQKVSDAAAIASDKISQQGLRIEESMRREIALYGDVSRAATARYDIEKGALQNLNAEQKQSIVGLAQRLDALDSSNAAFRGNEVAVNKAGKAYQNFGNLSRQVGFQVQDAVVQLQGGQNAALVFSQQGSQLLSVFHPLLGLFAALAGVVAGAFITSLFNGGKVTEDFVNKTKALVKELKDLNTAQQAIVNNAASLSLADQQTQYEKLTVSVNKQIEKIKELNAENGKKINVYIASTGGTGGGRLEEQRIDNTKALADATRTLSAAQLEQIGLEKSMAELKDPNAKAVADFTEQLREEIETLKGSTTALYEYKAAKLGASPEQTAEIVRLGSAISKLKEYKKESKETAKETESRAVSIGKVNLELDNQINRMGMLKEARDAQSQYDQIEEKLFGKKIKLSQSETIAIQNKIAAIQKATIVQQQFDAIYESAIAPARDYNATLEAADKLLSMGAISQERYTATVLNAKLAYNDSIDPLSQLNGELAQQAELLKLLPKQREIEAQVQDIVNQKLSENIILTKEQTQAMRESLTASQAANDIAREESQLIEQSQGRREQYINQLAAIKKLQENPQSGFTKSDALNSLQNSEVGEFITGSPEALQAQVDALGENYARIDQLRQADLLSEQSAAAAKLQIWNAQQNLQLKTAKGFFGNLEGLTKTNNSKLAAIGKAAAISNALISTYQSATAAYAAMASIPYVGPALGIAAAAGAVALGLANVETIRQQPTGFMTGGYTGSIGTNEVAGVVHGQEFVMNAAATSRIGVGNLQAMQNGMQPTKKKSGGSDAAVIDMTVNIVNRIPDAQFQVNQLDERTVEIIAERIVKTKTDENTASNLANPSSKTSKALARNTKTVRNV